MSLSKNLTVVAGISALVVLSYVGFGLYSQDNLAMAQDKAAEKQATKVDLESEQAKLGYTIGVQIGRDLSRGGVAKDIDVNALVAAIKDAVAEQEPQMTNEEMAAAQQAFQLKRQEEYSALVAKNKAAGEAFMVENKDKKGVKTTESGLQYEVLRKGKGDKPASTDTVSVHYAGTLIDGSSFDSSYSRNAPAEFNVGSMIPGFSEGLQLMKVGAKYRFVIPSDQAYGERAPESIGPNQVLVFEVELLDIVKQAETTEKTEESGE